MLESPPHDRFGLRQRHFVVRLLLAQLCHHRVR